MPKLKEVIEMGRRKLNESSDLSDGRFHIASELSLEVLERHADGLEEVSVEEFRHWLKFLSNNMSRQEYEVLLEGHDASDLIRDMRTDTAALQAETDRRRRHRQEALMAIARELGSVGARVALGALFA